MCVVLHNYDSLTHTQAAQTFSKVKPSSERPEVDQLTLGREANDKLHQNGIGDPGPGCIHVNTSTHRLVDGYGRERYFHGVNVVVKGPPWIPRQDVFDPYWSFVEEDMQLLQDWGLNAIRYNI